MRTRWRSRRGDGCVGVEVKEGGTRRRICDFDLIVNYSKSTVQEEIDGEGGIEKCEIHSIFL